MHKSASSIPIKACVATGLLDTACCIQLSPLHLVILFIAHEQPKPPVAQHANRPHSQCNCMYLSLLQTCSLWHSRSKEAHSLQQMQRGWHGEPGQEASSQAPDSCETPNHDAQPPQCHGRDACSSSSQHTPTSTASMSGFPKMLVV